MDRHPAYDDDFYAWTQDQARRLRDAAAERVNAPIDWENLAEEVESMERSEVRALGSALMWVIEHLLKLEHAPAADRRPGWEESVLTHRVAAWEEMEASPSLRGRIDLERRYQDARRFAARGMARDGLPESVLPDACPYTLEQVLDHDWWPVNRHGLED